MVSKNQIKLITSLKQKKYRNSNNLFLAEGIKVIKELLGEGIELENLYTTDKDMFSIEKGKIQLISEFELNKISLLKTPNKALAVFKIPEKRPIVNDSLILALDNVRDPGNLGTIIRLCDWFGINDLVCSLETVDCYNPKVVQATMGSLARVNISYKKLDEFLITTSLETFAADMDGENIYRTILPEKGVLIMGNEANGISSQIEGIVKRKLTIPRFGNTQQTESLNVATATAILLSEFRRKS